MKMSPEMPVHHPKSIHYQVFSCITFALPKCAFDPVVRWAGGIRQRREYVEVADNMRRKIYKYQKIFEISLFLNQTLILAKMFWCPVCGNS